MTQNLASSSGHAVERYQSALQTGEVALRDTCLQYLSWNLSSVLQSEEWTTVSIDLLMTLQRLDLILQVPVCPSDWRSGPEGHLSTVPVLEPVLRTAE
nr:BTB/POZ domain-containing protein 17-like [Oncorhynchus nerka]